MGLTQIDVNIGRQDEVLMPSDLRPTVPSQGAIQLFGQLTGLFDQCLDDAESVLVANLCEHHVTRVSLDQCCDEAVAGACDEVTLPMARHGPTFHLGWPVTDRYCVSTAGQCDERFFRFVILDHLFHKLIHLNYWSEILRPPLAAVDPAKSAERWTDDELLACV